MDMKDILPNILKTNARDAPMSLCWTLKNVEVTKSLYDAGLLSIFINVHAQDSNMAPASADQKMQLEDNTMNSV